MHNVRQYKISPWHDWNDEPWVFTKLEFDAPLLVLAWEDVERALLGPEPLALYDWICLFVGKNTGNEKIKNNRESTWFL